MTRPGQPSKSGLPGPSGQPGTSGTSGLFGDEGQRLLGQQHTDLFPATVLPSFLRLLWAVLALLAIGATVVLVAIGGRLP